jgi:hypothetical protein
VSQQPVVLFLPYFISILLKLTSLFLDRPFILESLQKLASIPPPKGEPFVLTPERKEVIADYVEFAFLRTTVITTTFASTLSAAILTGGGLRAPFLLFACVTYGVLLLCWVLPKPVPYFNTTSRLGLRRGTLAILGFCAYDILLAAITIFAPAETHGSFQTAGTHF